jgi:RNA polymerase sigma factor (sigma-70 family)
LSGTDTLEDIISGCLKANRESQKQLYKLYYSFSMGICMRYCNNNLEAEEIVNDSFLKIFSKLNHFQARYQSYEASFVGWIKKIIIHTAIDNFRKYNSAHNISLLDDNHFEISETDATPIDTMSFKEILELVQNLSPIYRTVFNLYILDGYKHQEIANKLNITVGTSKSNLAKARMNIQKMLKQKNLKLYEQRKAI